MVIINKLGVGMKKDVPADSFVLSFLNVFGDHPENLRFEKKTVHGVGSTTYILVE